MRVAFDVQCVRSPLGAIHQIAAVQPTDSLVRTRCGVVAAESINEAALNRRLVKGWDWAASEDATCGMCQWLTERGATAPAPLSLGESA